MRTAMPFALLLFALAVSAALVGAAPALTATATPPRPTATATPAPNDPYLAAQAAALLPGQVADLRQAGAWDRYTIIAALSPADQTIRGTTTVLFTNRAGAPLSRIAFRLYPNHPDFGGRLDITSATVNDAPVASSVAHSDTLLQLELRQPLAPGAQANVVLGFTARTPRNSSGRSFGAFNQEAGVWSMANFYPVLARYSAGTGWDTRPIESRGDFTVTSVALYDVTIDTPGGWALVATGVPISSTAVNANVRRERFVSGPQREFYLAALQGLDQASAVVNGTRIVSYYQRGNPEAGRRSLEIAERSLRAFNARYGPYPLAELEVIQAALTLFLGMEYPGVVLIEQRLYQNNGRGLETTIAHEIGHQWWYSQVGNDAQRDPWLDEGMASYTQVVYAEALNDPARVEAELQFFRDTYTQARDRGRDAPLATPPSELRGNYVAIVYAKAGLFFHALRGQIGEAAFSRFLQSYYSTYRYREASGADLIASAQQACSCDLTRLYNDWVLTAAPVKIP